MGTESMHGYCDPEWSERVRRQHAEWEAKHRADVEQARARIERRLALRRCKFMWGYDVAKALSE